MLQLVHLSDLRDDDECRCSASGVGAWALIRPPALRCGTAWMSESLAAALAAQIRRSENI
jgi:hypothetical protein